MTLTEFLLARIDEDDAKSDAAAEAEAESCRNDGMPDTTAQEVRDYWADQSWWRRRLAECEAKRRLVTLINDLEGYADRDALGHILAAIYADHPDYDEAWRS